MDITTPIRIEAATITLRRFCKITEPVSVPVIMLAMSESTTTNATHCALWFPVGVDYPFIPVGCPPSSLYTFPVAGAWLGIALSVLGFRFPRV